MLEFQIGEKLGSLDAICHFLAQVYASHERDSEVENLDLKPEEYCFVYKVLDYSIKREYETNDQRRVQLLRYLSNFRPDENKSLYDIGKNYEEFKKIMIKILKSQNKVYHPVLVVVICFINDKRFSDPKSSELMSRLLLSDLYGVVLKYKLTIMQLKPLISGNKAFLKFSNELISDLLDHTWIPKCDEHDYIEYHYVERYTRDFKIPSIVKEKIRAQVMTAEYLNLFSTVMITDPSAHDLLGLIEKTTEEYNGNSKKVSFFLEKKNTVNNEWIIKDSAAKLSHFSASQFNNIVKDPFIRAFSGNFIANGDDHIRVLMPVTEHSYSKESLLMSLNDHLIKRILCKLSNRQLFDILAINKRLSRIISEIIYYRPYVSTLENLQKLELTLLKSSMNLTKYPYHVYVKRLNFSFFNRLLDQYTLKYMTSCTLVERLTLVNCYGVQGNSVALFIGKLSDNLLTSLDLSGVWDLNDLMTMTLINKCSVSLQGLYAPNLGCSKFSLQELIKNCTNLKRLRLNNCIHMDSFIAMSIGEYLNRLVELDLSGCEDVDSDAVFKILMKLSNLRDFNLNGCKKLESKFITSLYDADKRLEKLKNLDIGNLNNFSSFKDADIKMLVYIAPNLKHLTLNKHKELTDASLKYISRLNKTLATLNIGHLSNITDNGINYLLTCSKITYLDLSSCEKISSDGLISLAIFKRLKRLGLVKCSQLDDCTLLIFLSKTEAKLERVHLSYCQQLTCFSIFEFLRRHINIQHLSVSGIPAIRSIAPLIKQYSRPSPPNFTSEQRISFTIFSGYKDVNSFKKVLNETLIDKNISNIFARDNNEKPLFSAYLNYCKYRDWNFIELFKAIMKELITTTMAYDYIINRYSTSTINQNENVIISEARLILSNSTGDNTLKVNELADYFTGCTNETDFFVDNGTSIKNSTFIDMMLLIESLDIEVEEETNKANKNYNELGYSEISQLIKDANLLLTSLKRSLETWENNLFSYLTVPSQRASVQQFKRVEANMHYLKILYNSLLLVKESNGIFDPGVWFQQIKSILKYICAKFEQLAFITFFREFIALSASLQSFEFIDNLNVIVNLTENLRESILTFRKHDYSKKNDHDKLIELQKSKEKFFFDLLEFEDFGFRNDNISFFPGFYQ